jgi:hypothetical protein
MFWKKKRPKTDVLLDQIESEIKHASDELESLASWLELAANPLPQSAVNLARARLLRKVSRLRDELEVENYLAGRPQAW